MQFCPILAAAAAILMLAPAHADAPDSEAGMVEEPLAGKPPYRRIFLDAMVVEESANLERVFHQAEKYAGNPILKPERPWEGVGVAGRGTVMWYGGKLIMFYRCIGDKDTAGACLAESNDGLHWERPSLGLIEYKGSRDNNITNEGTGSIIRVRKPRSPQQVWAIYGPGGKDGTAKVRYSDSILSFGGEKKEGLFKTSDVCYFFYDPYEDRYVATYKMSNRRHRAVGLALSKDGLEWSKPVGDAAIFGADDLDPDATQIYGMPVFPYQGMYIGMPWIYHSRWMKYGKYDAPAKMYEAEKGSPRTVDVQIAWSWDLISWNRTPKREPFIPLGPKGSWESSQIYTVRNPVIVGDKLYIYYYAGDRIHGDPDVRCATGLAMLRLDGFCSMHAGSHEGWLISRREVFATPKVTINAKCGPSGFVEAELVDRDDNVIPGFSRADCVAFRGDSVHAELSWKTRAFPPEWLDKDKKIRFFLRDADLYSYLPVDIDTGKDTGRAPD